MSKESKLKDDVKLDRPSTVSPSITEEKVKEQPAKAVEYPKGLELFFIMLALVLSITLCALDQVSSTTADLSR